MSALLQDVIVGAIVLAAVAFLVARRVRRKARPSAMCGDCPGCATGPQAPTGRTLVSIGEPDRR